ncbi:MAG: CAP domain-containing protein [Bacteroidota bacterium]
MRTLRIIAVLVMGSLFVTCSQSESNGELPVGTGTDGQTNPIDAVQMEIELLNLINEHRAQLGKSTLLSMPAVEKYAEDHNTYMISQNRLSHDNFNSRAVSISNETSASEVAENVARFYGTAEKALEGWLDSNDHKGTLEGSYSHTALKINLDASGKPYFTQIFLTLK